MSEVYVPDKDWFSDQFGNELTVDEVDAPSASRSRALTAG